MLGEDSKQLKRAQIVIMDAPLSATKSFFIGHLSNVRIQVCPIVDLFHLAKVD